MTFCWEQLFSYFYSLFLLNFQTFPFVARTCQIRASVASWLTTAMATLFKTSKWIITPVIKIMIRFLFNNIAAVYVGQNLPLPNTSTVGKVMSCQNYFKNLSHLQYFLDYFKGDGRTLITWWPWQLCFFGASGKFT